MHFVQVRVAALRKCAQQVQRRRRLIISLNEAFRIRPTRFLGKFDPVDNIAAVTIEGYIALRFGRRGARFGELARHTANFHDRH